MQRTFSDFGKLKLTFIFLSVAAIYGCSWKGIALNLYSVYFFNYHKLLTETYSAALVALLNDNNIVVDDDDLH